MSVHSCHAIMRLKSMYTKTCESRILVYESILILLSVRFREAPVVASLLYSRHNIIIGHGRDGFPTYPGGISAV